MLRKLFLLIIVLVTLVILAGVYRFNFTNDDIYLVGEDGQVTVLGKYANKIILTLFGIQTNKEWAIHVPETKVKANLNKLISSAPRYLVTGEYSDGEAYGIVSLDYSKITTLNVTTDQDEMVFVAPFSVSNQGSGVFWYLGLFTLDTDSGDIKQTDTVFVGDRFRISSLQTEEPFDVTSSVLVTFLRHGPTQSMSEVPSESGQQSIKLSAQGFVKQ